jgi:hypothetical protein
MENNKTLYVKTDDNKIINEKCIRWVKNERLFGSLHQINRMR